MRNNAGIQIMGFLTILFFSLFIYKYYVSYQYPSYPQHPYQQHQLQHPLQQQLQQQQLQQQQQQLQQKQHQQYIKNTVIDDTINMSPNDLQIVANKFNIYDSSMHIDATGFENELANDVATEGIIIDRSFARELNEIYDESTQISTLDTINEISKPQKSDLPIANVPAYLLETNEPLRLSEKPKP